MIHLLWKDVTGEVLKGLAPCDTPSSTTRSMRDRDLNYGLLRPGMVSAAQVVSVSPFSWTNNGDPDNAIVDCGLHLGEYYSADPTYDAEAGKTFCDGSTEVAFGDYDAAGGSNSPAFDLGKLLEWGDAASGGLEVSLDRGITWTRFKTGVGDSIENRILLPASAMDVGVVAGQIEPGDRALLFLRLGIPASYTDLANAGVYLTTLNLYYTFTE